MIRLHEPNIDESVLKEENWQTVRNQLASDDNLVKAQEFISKIKGDIRIFVTDGLGMGDQMFPINIIEALYKFLKYTGRVAVIADNEGGSFYEPALQNALKLYDAEHLFKKDTLNLTLPEGIQIQFYELTYFRKILPTLPEVELAIFPGLLGRFEDNFGDSILPAMFFSQIRFFYRLSEIAKAKAGLFINFFTASYFEEKPLGIGFISQSGCELPHINYLSHSLSNPLTPISNLTVHKAISGLQLSQPALADFLLKIVGLQQLGKIATFAVYGVHHVYNPIYPLLNLLLAAKRVNTFIQKPIIFMIMSQVSSDDWKQVQNNFLNHSCQNLTILNKWRCNRVRAEAFWQAIKSNTTSIAFHDNFTSSMSLSFNNNSIIVYKLPILPWKIFNYLFDNSLFQVSEGVNAAILKENAQPYPKYGLPCPALIRGERSSIRRGEVADHYQLPKDLIEAARYICPSSDEFAKSWKSQPYPDEVIARLMIKYSNSTERPRLALGNNRLAFALKKMSEDEKKFDQKNCPIAAPFPSLSATALKGFGYGLFEGSSTYLFERYGLEKRSAYMTTRTLEYLLQMLLENRWALLINLSLELSANFIRFFPRSTHVMFTSIMFMSAWLPEFFGADLYTQLYIITTTFISLLTHTAGRQVSEKFCKTMDTMFYRLFSHNRSPASSVQCVETVGSSP